MRISVKSILWLWTLLVVLMAAMFYSAYTRLEPDAFVTSLNEIVKQNDPKAELKVSDVKYKFSVDFNFVLEDLQLSREGSVLAKMKELEVRVPWWLVLFGKGSAQIGLRGLEVFIREGGKSPVQVIAAPQDVVPLATANILRLKLPGFLSEALFTLRANDVSLKGSLSGRNYLSISKLLVREFQYGKNSAFEINIPIKISHPGANFSSDLWLFGDVTPDPKTWVVNFRGDFKTKEASEKTNIDDLVIDGTARYEQLSRSLFSNVELLVDRKNIGKGSFSSSTEGVSLDLDLVAVPVSFLSMLGNETLNPFWRNINGTGNGSLSIQRNLKSKDPIIKGKLAYDGSISFDNGKETPGKWMLSFENARWETSFISPLGDLSYFRRSHVDLASGRVTQFAQEIGISGIDLSTSTVPLLGLGEFMHAPADQYFTSDISLKDCTSKETVYSGNFRYGITPGHRFYTGTLSTADSGSIKLKYQRKDTAQNIDVHAINFPFTADLKFLSPFFAAKMAQVSGTVRGSWSEDDWEAGKWTAKLSVDGEPGEEGFLPFFKRRLLQQLELNPIGEESPSKHHWDLRVQGYGLRLNKFSFSDDKTNYLLTGELRLDTGKKSWIAMSQPSEKKFKPVRKEVEENFFKDMP